MNTDQKRHDCTKCTHSMRDPAPTPEQQIRGHVEHLCMRAPPTPVGVLTPQGVMLVTTYPRVNHQTLTCGEYLSRELVGG